MGVDHCRVPDGPLQGRLGLRPLEFPEVAGRRTDDMLEVEDESVERQSLRRRRHPLRHDQMFEKRAHGIGILPDIGVTAEGDEAVYPESVRFFGSNRISAAPDRLPKAFCRLLSLGQRDVRGRR